MIFPRLQINGCKYYKPQNMKNRNLPSGVLALIIGFSVLFLQNVGMAGPAGDGPSSVGPLNLSWSPLGPDNVSGRTRAVIYDSRDASGNTIYASGVSGGLYKSTNLGLTWNVVPVSSDEVLKVTCMIQAPNGTIFVGTGEDFCVPTFSGLKDFNYTTSFVGSGIWYSENGENFLKMPGTQPTVGDMNSEWAFINKLAVDVRNGRLYAATNKGLKYFDPGSSWNTAMSGYAKEVATGPDGTVLTQVDDSCYIAVEGNVGNFVNLSTGTETGLPKADIGTTRFGVAPTDENIIYATIAKKSDNNLLGVYVSENKGVTWSVILPGNSTFDPYGGQGCYSNVLIVIPTDPTQVLVGGQDMWRGKKYQSTGYYSWEQVSFSFASELYPLYIPASHHSYAFRPNENNTMLIGSDGGVTTGTMKDGFKTGNKQLMTSQFYSVGFTYAKNIVIGGVQNKGTQLIDGTMNTPQAARQVWDFYGEGTGGDAAISLINPRQVIYSLNGGQLRTSDDRGLSYSLKFPGDNISNTANYILPFAFWESFNFTNSRDSIAYYAREAPVEAGQSVLVYSPNAKFPFYHVVPVNVPVGDSVKIQDIIQSRFITYFAKSSRYGLYMTKDVLQYTKDPEWFQISAITDVVTCIAVSNDMNYLLAGTKTGKIYRVSNLALAYNYATADVNSPTCIVATELIRTIPDGRAVTSVAFSPEDNTRAVFTLGGYGFDNYVYVTSNALDSIPDFVSAQGNLPKIPVYSSLIEMQHKNNVIIGTDYGIYSTDNIVSGNWAQDNSGVGTVPVFMIKQQTTYQPPVYIENEGVVFTYPGVQNWGAIYAATYGKGLYVDTTFITVGVDPGPVYQNSYNRITVYPNPVRDAATVSYLLGKNGDVNFMMYDISGRTVKTFSQNNVTSGEHKLTVNLNGLPAGTYVIQMKSPSGNAYGKLVKVN